MNCIPSFKEFVFLCCVNRSLSIDTIKRTYSFKFFVLFLIAKSIDTEILNFLKIKVNMEKTDTILPVLKPNFVVNIMGPAVAFLL